MSNREAYIARIAELNACKTPEEVANLLRVEGVKGEKTRFGADYGSQEEISCRCALARDFQRFEPKARVGYNTTWVSGIDGTALGAQISLTPPVQSFIDGWDSGHYPDLEV